MSYKKKKNTPTSVPRQMAFVLGWLFSYLVAFFLAATPWLFVDTIGNEASLLARQLLFSVFISAFHYLLICHILRFNVSKWLLLSIVGWLIGGFLPTVNLTQELPYFYRFLDEFNMAFNLLIWGLPASILQWLVLRRHVRSAWLWLLANAVPITTLTAAYLLVGSRPVIPPGTIWMILFLQAVLPAPIMVYFAKRARTSQGALQQSSEIADTDDTATRLALTDDDVPAQDATTTTTSHPRLQAGSG